MTHKVDIGNMPFERIKQELGKILKETNKK